MSTDRRDPREAHPVLSSADLAGLVDNLANVDRNAADPELIDQITQLERLKSACAAAQATLTLAFVTSQTAGLTQRQQRDSRAHRSIRSQIALARHDSPARGGRHVGAAKALIREMPHTCDALRTGEISEWRATLIIRETACLSVEHRQQVDKELAGTLATMGDRQTANTAAGIAQRLDPASCVERNRKALTERRVSIRPAPDTMTYLSALLSVAHGVAVYAALNAHATNAKAAGDQRGHAQLMADELVHRVTEPGAAAANAAAKVANTGTIYPAAAGTAPDSNAPDRDDHTTPPAASNPVAGTCQPTAECPDSVHNNTADTDNPDTIPPGVNLDIQLVMTDRTLFDGDDEPAILIGYGPIPAPIARQLVRTANPKLKAWIRRLYTDPDTGHLINGDAKRRDFSYAARQFFVARDHTCRTAWCDAPIRHSDHVTAHTTGGPTTITNGQGICEACNYTKQAPGWQAVAETDGCTIALTTPTGHVHRTRPPAPPRSAPWSSKIQIALRSTRPIEVDLTKTSCAFWWSATALIKNNSKAELSARKNPA